MTHQQILDKLAAGKLVQSIDEDLSKLVSDAMNIQKNDHPGQLAYFLPKLMLRWNCVLLADREISMNYRHKTVLALAILLHKYGFADQSITDKAILAIDALNAGVVLSDDFYRKSNDIKAFIQAVPVPLKKRPSVAESMTFYRGEDVISIQMEQKYYAAYIHYIQGVNESPVLEFYDGEFDQVPSLSELEKLPARGAVFNDGIARISLYAVNGLKFLPDLAGQIQLISACVKQKPANEHLEKPDWLYTLSNLFDMQRTIKSMFEK
ncbi:hypothetical protein CLV59_104484 [Chitinophaga dinghuensis]|uniref:Uncharacterized protein n=1 Tax=Chitinophaga dinghuensis TaxID=1539050 RepID=A0A327VZ43_9BACT|nr:hypothetical protein [Chitinophaga dinghuensis]RAJ82259.1 hypothetical protein CLV59_104484 [Chitinophaga dinghuensis]